MIDVIRWRKDGFGAYNLDLNDRLLKVETVLSWDYKLTLLDKDGGTILHEPRFQVLFVAMPPYPYSVSPPSGELQELLEYKDAISYCPGLPDEARVDLLYFLRRIQLFTQPQVSP